jgi:hypothetical protein
LRCGPAIHAARAEDAEELAARLWDDLVVGRRRRMHASDPARGRTGAFLAALARQQLWRLSRAALRPGRALAPLPEGDIAAPLADVSPEREPREEFVGRLTPADRRFYRERLPAPGAEPVGPAAASPARTGSPTPAAPKH